MNEYYGDDMPRGISQLVADYESAVRDGREVNMPVPDLLDVAEYYIKADRLSEADACLAMASRLYPDDEEVKLMTAYRLRDEGLWEEAIALVNTFQDKLQRDVRFFYIDAQVAMMNLRQAEKMFRDIVGPCPGSEEADAYITFAEILLNYALYERAIGWLRNIPAQMDNQAEVSFSLCKRYHDLWGEACFQLRRYKEAAEHANALVDLDPYDECAWVMLADCQMQMGELEKASDTVEYALSIHPQSARAIKMKLLITAQMGHREDIGLFTDLLRQYFEQFPNDHVVFEAAGDYLHSVGSLDICRDIYARALRCCPLDAAERQSLLAKLAQVEIERGNSEDALETLQCTLAQSSNAFQPFQLVADALFANGEKEKGVLYLRRFINDYGMPWYNILDIITMLSGHEIYQEASDIWMMIFKVQDEIPEPGHAMMAHALRNLHLSDD